MNVTYGLNQISEAEIDVIEIYKLAESRIEECCIGKGTVELRNAFQVFRYAFREWALSEDEGTVLRALMLQNVRVTEDRDKQGNPEIKNDRTRLRHMARSNGVGIALCGV